MGDQEMRGVKLLNNMFKCGPKFHEVREFARQSLPYA
jgi:hypothetical protein